MKRFAAVALLIIGLVVAYFESNQSQPVGESQRATTPEQGHPVVQAFNERRSDLWLTTSGVVDRVLPDDNKGSRHQRFLLRVTDGHTVLVAHNIDLASKVPLSRGDSISLRGEYEWNEKGGVIHWTHHDPQGRRDGGYIQFEGERYE
ncbi:MAG: DUF3465 domain-containing protein [Pseudomonadota bacterium]